MWTRFSRLAFFVLKVVRREIFEDQIDEILTSDFPQIAHPYNAFESVGSSCVEIVSDWLPWLCTKTKKDNVSMRTK